MTLSVGTTTVQGVSGSRKEYEELTAQLQVLNEGSERLDVEVTFWIDSSELPRLQGSIEPSSEQWFSQQAGSFAAGSHHVKASVAPTNGIDPAVVGENTFEVEAGPPSIEMGELRIQAESNVLEAGNAALPGDKVLVGIRVKNTGSHEARLSAVIVLDADTRTVPLVLAPGQEDYPTEEFGPVEAGKHLATVSVHSADGQVLDTKSHSLSVEASPHLVKTDVLLTLHSFKNTALNGQKVSLIFTGVDGTKANDGSPVDGDTADNGSFSRPGIQIPAEGNVTVIVTHPTLGQFDNVLHYALPAGQTTLAIDAKQDSSEMKITTKRGEEVKDTLTRELGAEHDFEIIKIDGRIAEENEKTTSFETEVELTLLVAEPGITFSK